MKARIIAKLILSFLIATSSTGASALVSGQMAIGKMTINDQSENVAVGTSSVSGPMSVIHGFFALELVLRRFGDGAFSLIASNDLTGNGRGTKIFPHDVDGMSDFHGSFSRNVDGMAYGFGLKLVTAWA